MAGFILGKKINQSQSFNAVGDRIPITLINTESCHLVDIKWPDQDGYLAVKLGFGQTKKIGKSIQGQLTKAGISTPLRFLKEIRLDKFIKNQPEKIKPIEENGRKGMFFFGNKIFIGERLSPLIFFKKNDKVTVSGISKGKGFQGVVKRHHFKGGPKTHGQSDRERAPGSIGMTTTPGRVFKGKRMAGRMGGQRVTIKNLLVVDVQKDSLVVKGLVPGAKGGLVEVKSY